jgi:hypothetical protein
MTFNLIVKAGNRHQIISGKYIVKIIFKKIILKNIFDENMKPKVPIPLVGFPISKEMALALMPKIPKVMVDVIVFAGYK